MSTDVRPAPGAPTRPRRRLVRVVRALAWVAVAAGALAWVFRTWFVPWQSAAVLAAFSPHLAALGVLGAVVLLTRRGAAPRVAAAVAAVVAAGTVLTHVPLFVADAAPPGTSGGVGLVLLQANLRLGRADATAVVDHVRADRVDVLTLDELTPEEVGRLRAAGLDALLPHHVDAAQPGGSGIGVWSRYPLGADVRPPGFSLQLVRVPVQVPGAAPVQLVAAHLTPPWPGPGGPSRGELDRFGGVLDAARSAPGAVVASGDLNAPTDDPQLRGLLTHGYGDAADRSGAGYRPTWPADLPIPPLLALDHVLTRGANATAVSTVDLPGSDHRGLLVHLQLPRRTPA